MNFLKLRIRLLASEGPERQLSAGVVSKPIFLGLVFKVYFFLAFPRPYFSYRFALFWLHETPCGTGQIRDSLNNRSFFVSEFYLTCYLKDVHMF